MQDALNALFTPRTVAVVGASDDTSRIGGGLILHFLKQHGFSGPLYPVNPKRDVVQGLTCYPSLSDAPAPVDLGILAVPAPAILRTVESLPKGHTRVLLVIASGFSEIGEDGAALEADLIDAAREKGITLIGPNSVGVVNMHHNLVATISQFFDRTQIPAGRAALVSQSGAFGTALLAQAAAEGVDFGVFLSSGNEAKAGLADFGCWLCDCDEIDVISAYVEGIKHGPAFMEFARKANAANKPVVALKVGVSETGARAARLHTGAIAGSDRVADAIFDTFNIVRVSDSEALVDTLKAFASTSVSAGKRLAVLSHSGGAGVIAADAAEAAGIQLPPLPDDLKHTLSTKLPGFATFANPLDMTGGASMDGALMADCLQTVLEHDAFDAAILAVNLIWRDGPVLLDGLNRIAKACDKPFAVSWAAPREEVAAALRLARFPSYGDPARAANALAKRLTYDARRREIANEIEPIRSIGPERPTTRGTSTSDRLILEAYGIGLPRECLADSVEDATRFAAEVGGPVALKIASPDIPHRTEIGAVATGLADPSAVANAYSSILEKSRMSAPAARIDGVLVQEMVEGVEAHIGVHRDPVFGPVLALGPGGVFVELYDDTRLRPAPVSHDQSLAMIARTRLNRLLSGYRGAPVADSSALAAMASRVSWLAHDNPALVELDLNPVIVRPDGAGCIAVDYKLVWS